MPQTKSADATIRGFLFQFQEIAIQLFDSDEKITVEGLDQDIELENLHIQCKYYKNWTNTDLRKTIKPIYKHFLKNIDNKDLKYKLNIHISDTDESKDINKIENLKSVLKLGGVGDKLKFTELELDKSNLEAFISKFTFHESNSIEENELLMSQKLAEAIGLKSGNFLYSAVIGEILKISSADNVGDRSIDQSQFKQWLGSSTQILAMEWFLARENESKYNKEARKLIKDYSHSRTIFLFNKMGMKQSGEITNLITQINNFKKSVSPTFCFDNGENNNLVSDAKNILFDRNSTIIDEYPFLGSSPKISKITDHRNERYIKFVEKQNIEKLCDLDSNFTVIHFYIDNSPDKVIKADQNYFIPLNSLGHLLTILN